jgi:hypothetical protein
MLLLIYVATFLFWKAFPSRAAFVTGGLCSVGILGGGMWRAQRRGYFCNRIDWALHAYVIIDLLLESLSYEGLRGVVELHHLARAYVPEFHNNNNYVFCSLTFAALIGGYRWYALRRKAAPPPAIA